jgi:hypothetical protein
MYSLIRRVEPRLCLAVELPCLVASMIIAELFYKFHSFSLECLAFLATWFVLSGTISALRGSRGDRN